MKDNLYKQIISKQDEYINHLHEYIQQDYESFLDSHFESMILRQELSELKAELEKTDEELSWYNAVHLKQEKTDDKFFCRFCNAIFTDEYELDAHVNFHHK